MTLPTRPLQSGDEAKALICELGRRFYELGWVSGTGGGISLRLGDDVYMAASGVPKEGLVPEMIYTLDRAGDVVDGPAPERGFKVSDCRPLFLHAFDKRGAGAVIHSHSQWAMLVTLAFADAFEVTHLEMQKGLAGVGYHDVHRVPIIDNTAHECDLADALADAMDREPGAHAVLVRRHGVYVWGDDWAAAKRHAECYDYLFRATLEMRRLGLDKTP